MKRLIFTIFLLLNAIPLFAQRQLFVIGNTITANVNDAQDFNIVLNKNVTSIVLTAPSATPDTGLIVRMIFTQDPVGSRTVAFGGNITTTCIVNATVNATTICQWKYTASNNTWTDAGGSGGTPGGVSTDIQCNLAGVFGPCAIRDNGTAVSVNEPLVANGNVTTQGPNPSFDVTAPAFGARLLTGVPSTTTATCINASTTVTLAAAIDFINGDGIVLQKCGPASSLSTPAAPSTVVQRAVANGVTTRSYKVIAEDFSNGLTAASPATSIANAAATLGNISAATTTLVTTVGGTATYTTAANHNLSTGALIQLGSGFGVFQVTATPAANTFTIQSPGFVGSDQTATATSLAVTVASHVQVYWTGQANVMRYWVCRQDGGAGNFTVVGVAQGQEPYFDDKGDASPVLPPNVPSICPAATPVNQSLATKIVSGAGTVNIVVADQASNSIGGVPALHDNTVAMIAACNAAIAVGGGSVSFPSYSVLGTALIFNFPLKFPSFNGDIHVDMGSGFNLNQPLIPGPRYFFHGNRSATNTAYPSFGRNNYVPIGGSAYPLVLVTTQFDAGPNRFENISFDARQSQQIGVLVDNSFGGGGPVDIDFYNNFLGGGPGAPGLVIRGVGFGYHLFNNTFSTASSTFNSPGSLRLMGSSTTVPTGIPGIGNLLLATFLGAGVHVDVDATNGAGVTNVGSPWTFDLMFSESIQTPLLDARNISSNNWYNWVFTNFQYADAASNAMGIDMTNSSGLIGFTVSGMAGGTTPLVANLIAVQGLTYVQNSFSDSTILPSVYAITRLRKANIGAGSGAVNSMAFETDSGLRLLGSAPAFSELAPPTNVAGAVAAGGAVPIGTWTYRVTAIGWNNGETVGSSISAPQVVTGGNQTVNLTWTASGIGTQGYNVYRSNGGSYIRVNNSIISTNSFTDNTASPNGTGIPTASGTGASYLRSTEISAPIFRVPSAGGALFKTDISSATLTANRSFVLPDANLAFQSGTGAVVRVSTLQTGYDNFNRANGALGANWTSAIGTVQVSGNAAIATALTGGNASAIWATGNTFSSDQFAEATIATLNGATDVIGASVRYSASGNGYTCIESSTSLLLQRNDANSRVTLQTSATTGVVGDVLRIEANATTITCTRIAPGGTTTSVSQVDATYATGSPGIFFFGTVATLDNWNGGNLHPLAQLDAEQDWVQAQHFVNGLTVGPTTNTAFTAQQGNGAKIQAATGTTVSGNLIQYDANGNAIDSGILANTISGKFTCVNVTPVTVNANVTTDQTLMACTVPASTLNLVGRTILIQLAGVYSTPAASTTAVNLKAKLCTVSGCGSGTVITLASITSAALGAIQVTNDPFNMTLNSSTQTAGASSAHEAHGNLVIDISALTTAAESVYADGNTATVGTIDSTVQLFLQITGSFTVASASNSMTQRQLIVSSVD